MQNNIIADSKVTADLDNNKMYEKQYLRKFQIKTKESLLEGKSVVVIAPTGLGKTLAAILPSQATTSPAKLKTRIMYTLPIRALSKGVQEEFRLNGVNAIIHHGDEPESKWFTEKAIITTVDQYFTAFAGVPLSWSSAVGHAAAGAILTSYTIFDEVHLLNPKNGLQLLFAILKLRNRWNLPTTVMTATLPDSVIDFLKTKCRLIKIEASEKDIKDRDSWRRVNLKLHDEELNVERLADFVKKGWEKYGKVLVFVNTVERAISLYKKLREGNNLKNKVLLAHSRFSKHHRKEIEEEIHSKFGRNSDFEGILVTTQVAEVGLNISAPLVITELAPMDSLIQRAGRCARFKENSGEVNGEVIVVKPKVENGRWNVPYFDYIRLRKGGTSTNKNDAFIKNKERITLSELTWVVLLKKTENAEKGIPLNWKEEKELLNISLNDAYYAFINGSDTIYFKKTKDGDIGLEDKEIGVIIQQYKNELRGG